PKATPLPPLVTTARGDAKPALGGASTSLLVGNQSIHSPDVAGGRFTLGFAVNLEETAGLTVSYLFLGSRTSSVRVGDQTFGRTRSVGRPVINAATEIEDAVVAALPGVYGGAIDASTTSRVTGWEVSGLVNLYADSRARLSAIAGYRYFMVNEGLRVEQTTLFPGGTFGPSVMTSAADQFDAHNRFHGGQLGLTADLTRGSVFLQASGKVALGQSVSVVQVSGQTVAISPGLPPPVTYYAGGVLAQPTNSGRWVRSGFAVLPEGMVKLGYRFADRSRFYVGYNFIYLSEAVRPGDQVDRTVDLAQVPVFGTGGPGTTDRPSPLITRSDFWVQGLMFGLEYRY
ncbi:MAG: BBP7 family outer membrane beta-barrel protein, partial [Gemmataceae bacterium]